MGKSKRDNQVDVVKALAIIGVVISHTDSPLNSFVCLFHVGVFFIASGLFFKDEDTYSCKGLFQYILKKLKGLWLPFAIWNSLFWVLQNFFLRIGFYTSDIEVLERIGQTSEDIVMYLENGDILKGVIRALLFAGGAQLGGPMWFLRILFQVIMVYAIVNFFLYKITKNRNTVIIFQGIIAFVFLIFGDYFSSNSITTLGIGKTFSYYSLFYIGYLFHNICLKWEFINNRIVNVAITGVSLSILCVLDCNGRVSYSAHSYPNLFFLLAAAIFGWLFLWGLAFFLKQCRMEYFLSYLGRKTSVVMILHVLCFKIVSALYIICTNKEKIYLAAFPSIEGIGAWWILYVIVGISASLMIDNFIGKIKIFLLRSRE